MNDTVSRAASPCAHQLYEIRTGLKQLRAGLLALILDHVRSQHASSLRHNAPADLCLVGGQIADVRSGTLRRAAVAITGPWITAVGSDEDLRSNARQVTDVRGQIITPGYIEPHTHVILTNPIEFARAVLPHGTTTAVVDALPLMTLARPDRLAGVLERLAALPMKLRWLIRLHPQSFSDDERFSLETLRPLWRLPSAAAVGEVTRWRDVYDGAPDLIEKIRAAKEDGKRVEGHAAGASFERLAVLADRGFTSCHEAMTAEEVTHRLRAGLAAMLRHSSIRPDLPRLAAAVTPDLVFSPQLMLTADGPTPVFIAEHGYMDHLIEIAIRSGIPPMAALRMATLNPAVYYGNEATGEIAVGRRADLNVLRDLSAPRPTLVIADGRIVAQDGTLSIPMPAFSWEGVFEPVHLPQLATEVFETPPTQAVGCRLVSDVITEPIAGDAVPADAFQVALIDRRGRWMTRCYISGFADRLGGLATTVTSAFDLLVIGRRPEDMAHAARRVAELGGGLVVVDSGIEVFELRLDLGGVFSSRSWAEVVEDNHRFNLLMQSRGYRFTDPIFTLLFLTFDSLPWVRLTSRGVWDVRHRRILAPATPLS